MTPQAGTSIGLRVQVLPRLSDQVLVVADIEASRGSAEGAVTTDSIRQGFDAIAVPEPRGLKQAIARLIAAKHLRRTLDDTGYRLTPLGRQHVLELLGGPASDVGFSKAVESFGFAELSGARHPVIPPSLAPEKFAPAVAQLLHRYPFERNLFVMTRFPRSETEGEMPDPVKRIIDLIREESSAHGLVAHLASDRSADDELFGNIAAHMWACKYGIGLFETRYGNKFNDNLQIEVGAMLMTGRRCLLLKDLETPNMPVDFVGQIYTEVDFDDIVAMRQVLQRRLGEDLNTAA